ncbi:uncharacterized protein TNCV_4041501 [Trichonephila clavipes]|nr:uncharacterized protein TNCV_4041501 [Trichonephila clavipes]
MVNGCDATPEDSADVVGSKLNVLKAAVSVVPPQPNTVNWWKVPWGTYPARRIRGTWNRPECHFQALTTIQGRCGNVRRCYSTCRSRVTRPNEDRYIWQLLPKETDGAQNQTCLVSSLQLPVRHFQGRPRTDA